MEESKKRKNENESESKKSKKPKKLVQILDHADLENLGTEDGTVMELCVDESGETKSLTLPTGNVKEIIAEKSRFWCFTWWNYPKNFDKILLNLFKNRKTPATEFGYQEEIGLKSKKEHIQGYVAFENAVWNTALIKYAPAYYINMRGTILQNETYCSKDESKSRKPGGFRRIFPEKYVLEDPMEGLTLHQWQKTMLEILESKPDKRTIHWWWSKAGGAGKTTFKNYLVDKYENKLLTFDETIKPSDAYYILAANVEKKEYPTMIIWDMSKDTNWFYFKYRMLEQFKNGCITSGKYMGTRIRINPPHIFVFANRPPEIHRMSDDRWSISEIVDNNLTPWAPAAGLK